MACCCKSHKNILEDFEFSKDSLPLTYDTTREYKHVRDLFLRSIDILGKKRRKNLCEVVGDIEQMMCFYERSDILMSSLVNELFRMEFMENISQRKEIFSMLNKLLKMFFLFDVNRFRKAQVFHDFSLLYVYKHKDIVKKLPSSEILKICTFAAISMPMARLFVTYFSTDTFQIYHPIIMCKRAPLYLSARRKAMLNFMCRMMCKFNEFKYVVLFFCALHDSALETDCFRSEIGKLRPQEQAYFHAIKCFR
jgi:hypothetical protein